MPFLILFFLIVESVANAAANLSTEKICTQLLQGTRNYTEDLAWERAKPDIKREFGFFRLMSPEDQKKYLSEVGQKVTTSLRELAGGARLGVHFNLHGGERDSYTIAGGIRAQRGDIGLSYNARSGYRTSVYMFRIPEKSLEEILTVRNPYTFFFKERMGTVFVLFSLDHPQLQTYRENGIITQDGTIFMDFDEDKARASKSFFGVPAETYVVPPVHIFRGTKKILGERRLSWDEETLATLRFLESYASLVTTRNKSLIVPD